MLMVGRWYWWVLVWLLLLVVVVVGVGVLGGESDSVSSCFR